MLSDKHQHGFTLMELLIAVMLSGLMMSGIVHLMVASASSYRLQLNLSEREESGRYARDVLTEHITQAGFVAKPWVSGGLLPALTDESIDNSTLRGDHLGLQRWSNRNCFGIENPVKDSNGQAAFHLLQTRFQINTSNNLALTCRYGPDSTTLTTQMNNFGLVENVESMHILFAEDRNGDDIADTWITANNWQSEANIKAIKIALLVSTHQPFKPVASEPVTMLNESFNTPTDGKLRTTSVLTAAIRGRTR